MAYAIGLDYGTNSCRCVIVNTGSGQEIATAIYEYETGVHGIVLDGSDHNLARQNPADYIKGVEVAVRGAIEEGRKNDSGFRTGDVVGIGVDTTGSTPIPVDAQGTPLSMTAPFVNNPNAMAWLWKDHTSHVEAAAITEAAAKYKTEYLAKCGGVYSSEWFWSKVLHCLRVDADVFDAAYSWVECADYIPAVLTGTIDPGAMKRSRCAAGHKAMYSKEWGGLPSKDFLSRLDGRLAALRDRLYEETCTINVPAGKLTRAWAAKLGLGEGIPVAVGAFDAHLGAVGSGIKPGVLVKIIGTSTCDMLVANAQTRLADIPGICGIVDGSIVPGYYGLEAGQSAVGDIFNWFVNYIEPGGKERGSHQRLSEKAASLKPGQSGLLALDWNNGNRTVLVDQRLSGLLIGQTLHTRPEEIYRALVEATAFGALTIINRFEEYGISVSEIVNCGGIAEKNPMLMQIYADVTGREMKIARSSQACALGSAIAGAVAAGEFSSVADAQARMCAVRAQTFKPNAANQKVYSQLYRLYMQIHDAFGTTAWNGNCANIMKDLLRIKDQANA